VTPVEKAHARLRDAHVKAGWTGVCSVESPRQFLEVFGGPVVLRHWYGTHPTRGQEFLLSVEVVEPAPPTRRGGLAQERWTEDEG
jgi:hypothetical protein